SGFIHTPNSVSLKPAAAQSGRQSLRSVGRACPVVAQSGQTVRQGIEQAPDPYRLRRYVKD
ncbi:MAG: hypothetical protein AABY67_03145, partial [Nitrospirota bacterium]